ncbi:MAG: hypothetical protein IJD29_04145, partial [Anaerotignum sp.]|nr:hypothetical protein [Anaerotignum sp.]
MNVSFQRGQQVACMCWFPTKQSPFPYMVQFKDEEGDIHTIREIDIVKTEKVFQGIEYTCQAVFGDRKRIFKLMF